MLPILGIILRIDTLDVTTLLSSQTTSAMMLSLETATVSTAICIVFGLPLSYLIARSNSQLVQLLRVAIAIPLAIPPLISGALLLNIYGENSPLGLMAQHARFQTNPINHRDCVSTGLCDLSICSFNRICWHRKSRHKL